MGKTTKYLLLILLFFYLLSPYSMGAYFGYLILLIMFLNSSFIKSNIDKYYFIILLFSVCYAIFYSFKPDLGTQFIFIYAFFPSGFYLLGKYFFQNINEEKKIGFLVLVGFLFSLTTLISVLISIQSKGFAVIHRGVPSFWNADLVPATNMASYLILNMCAPAILFSTYKKLKKSTNILIIIVYILSFICILRLGSRTHIGISFITLIAAIIYKISKQSAIKNSILFVVSFFIINIIISFISIDKDSDLFSAFAGRLDSKKYGASTAGGRMERWQKSIEYIFKEPFGWNLSDFGFSHNLWFDVARVGGIICIIILIIYTIYILKLIYKILKQSSVFNAFNNQLLVYSTAFLLLFFVEPIFDGYFDSFTLFCFLNGMSVNYYNSEYNKINNQ